MMTLLMTTVHAYKKLTSYLSIHRSIYHKIYTYIYMYILHMHSGKRGLRSRAYLGHFVFSTISLMKKTCAANRSMRSLASGPSTVYTASAPPGRTLKEAVSREVLDELREYGFRCSVLVEFQDQGFAIVI